MPPVWEGVSDDGVLREAKLTRVVQPQGTKGSLKWIQRAVNGRWPSLESPILARMGSGRVIEWRSPLEADGFAEYRDASFLTVLGLEHLRTELRDFWPAGGPQWDALGLTNDGGVLLVEAKAHVGEMCSPGTGASEASRMIITERLTRLSERLGARADHAPWTEHFYQLANRLAHLQFLRDQGVSASLVLVNFLNDPDMAGPRSEEVWEAAYTVAHSVMGLAKRHALSRHVIHVFPDINLAGKISA